MFKYIVMLFLLLLGCSGAEFSTDHYGTSNSSTAGQSQAGMPSSAGNGGSGGQGKAGSAGSGYAGQNNAGSGGQSEGGTSTVNGGSAGFAGTPMGGSTNGGSSSGSSFSGNGGQSEGGSAGSEGGSAGTSGEGGFSGSEGGNSGSAGASNSAGNGGSAGFAGNGGSAQGGAAGSGNGGSGGSIQGDCVPGNVKCEGLTPQSCNSNGQWVAKTACDFICSAGACTGICAPNTTRCNGTTVQTCSTTGTWKNTTNCPSAPNAGATCSSSGICGMACKPAFGNCDGTLTNGCEQDLTDLNNCGACGNACNGGTCNNSLQCEFPSIKQLASASSGEHFNAIISDTNNLYVVLHTPTQKEIRKIVKSSGATSTLYQNTLYIQSLLVSGNYLYFSVETLGIYKVSVNGGTPLLMAPASTGRSTFHMETDGAYLYWIEGTGGTCNCVKAVDEGDILYRMSLTNGTPSVLYPLNPNYRTSELMPKFAVTGTNIYVLEMVLTPSGFRTALQQIDKSSGNSVSYIAGAYYNQGTLFSSFTEADEVTTDGSFVYFVAATDQSGEYWKVPAQSAAIVQSDLKDLGAVELTGQRPFMADKGTLYHANNVKVSGQALKPFIPGEVSDFTQDSQYVYYTSEGYWTAPPYDNGHPLDVTAPGVYSIKKP